MYRGGNTMRFAHQVVGLRLLRLGKKKKSSHVRSATMPGPIMGNSFFTLRIHAFVGRCDDSENDRAWRCTDTGRYTKKPAIMRAFDVIAKSFTWRY